MLIDLLKRPRDFGRRTYYFLKNKLSPLIFWWETRNKSHEELSVFTCNICGSKNKVLRDRMLLREKSSCYRCLSSLRNRSVTNALSLSLFGTSMLLGDFPASDSRFGVGLSDWKGMAKRLDKKLHYQNTFYHKEPYLDILKVDENQWETVDFVICSEVLEHVSPPVEIATVNLFHLLREGGFVIITVPYNTGGAQNGPTVEHFPDLHQFEIIREGDYHQRGFQESQVLVNTTTEGERQEFTDLAFHGGCGGGLNLEMRQFTTHSIVELLRASGFSRIEVLGSDFKDFGIEFLGEYRGQIDKAPVIAWK